MIRLHPLSSFNTGQRRSKCSLSVSVCRRSLTPSFTFTGRTGCLPCRSLSTKYRTSSLRSARNVATTSFSSSFKHAVITRLLKKPSLDKSVPSNYRPISNLNFISKILERLFLTRIQAHILNSLNFNQHQSAYRRNFSTETALHH